MSGRQFDDAGFTFDTGSVSGHDMLAQVISHGVAACLHRSTMELVEYLNRTGMGPEDLKTVGFTMSLSVNGTPVSDVERVASMVRLPPNGRRNN